MNSTSKKHLVAAWLAVMTVATAARAATMTIWSNNFDSVTAGTYNGNVGTKFGDDPLLGNASGSTNTKVSASGGVGSGWVENTSTAAYQSMQRSRNTGAITDATSFSFYVKTGTTTTNNIVGAAAGWGWVIRPPPPAELMAGSTGPTSIPLPLPKNHG